MSLRKAMWRGGLWGSQFYPNGNGLWRGGLWASERQGGGGGGTDWSSVEIGDEVEGGIYAGIITYADAREFRIIFGLQASETDDRPWGNYGTTTGADDPDDGWANQEEILNNHPSSSAEAYHHCRDYVDPEGNNDYYLPAVNELDLAVPLADMSHPEFSTDLSEQRLSSTELSSTTARSVRFTDGGHFSADKRNIDRRVRPVRRVAV